VRRTLMVLLTGAVVAGVPADAHHSFAADYFEEKTVSIEGVVEEFLYRNPHSLLVVMAKDESGRVERFTAEWGGAGRLAQRGVTSETLKPGDLVIITGSPGRNPSEHKLHLKGLHRPTDGWRWPRRAN